MSRKWLKLLALTFAFSLVAAACGDSDEDTAAEGDETTTTAEEGGDTTEAAEETTTTEGGTETTAGGTETTAGGGAQPASIEEWEALWETERQAIVDEIVDGGYGYDEEHQDPHRPRRVRGRPEQLPGGLEPGGRGDRHRREGGLLQRPVGHAGRLRRHRRGVAGLHRLRERQRRHRRQAGRAPHEGRRLRRQRDHRERRPDAAVGQAVQDHDARLAQHAGRPGDAERGVRAPHVLPDRTPGVGRPRQLRRGPPAWR